MTTYLRPGVFVEESLQTLVNSPLPNSTDAIPAFVGTLAKGGPVGPTLVSSWSQFTSLFGDIKGTVGDELPFAVYQFFNNGGSACYVVRAVNTDATAGHLALAEVDPDGSGTLTALTAMTVTALAPGAWSCSGPGTVYVTVDNNATTGRFNLTIEVGSGTSLVARETFQDVTLNPADPRYALPIVNSPTVGSKYVNIAVNGAWGDPTDGIHISNPASVSQQPLVSGSDGTGSPSLVTATELLETIQNILIINLPGVSDATVITSIVNWAEGLGNRFIVVDSGKPTTGATASDVQSAATALAATLPVSSYLAVYGPWLWASDPSSSVPGALRLTPPGGPVIGQYVRSDVTRGVQKVPAGTGTPLKINQTYCNFTSTQLDALNQAGINVIRSVPGAGFCIMGGRTLNLGAVDKYINVRRTLMYLKKNLINLTEFAVFENNDPNTWERVDNIISQFLRSFWLSNGLAGDTAEQAFYVICDATNNTQSSINAGVLNVQVGVALETPAEFIVISLGQFNSGTSTAIDSLSTSGQ